MLQPACVMGLMLLLPPIILALCYWQGDIALSWAFRRQTSRYFLFQVRTPFECAGPQHPPPLPPQPPIPAQRLTFPRITALPLSSR